MNNVTVRRPGAGPGLDGLSWTVQPGGCLAASMSSQQASPDKQLAVLLDELIDAGRTVVRAGLVQASGGNLSVRVPGTDAFAVTRTGTWLDRLTPMDFQLLGLDGGDRGPAVGAPVEQTTHQQTTGQQTTGQQARDQQATKAGLAGGAGGAQPRRASVEWRLHQQTYLRRPDVGAVVHLHPQHVLLVDMLGHPIRRTTLDHAFYLGSVARVAFSPAGSQELATAAAEAVADGCNAVVLAHHGCSTVADTVEMALRRALNLEEAAAMTYRLLMAGDTSTTFPMEFAHRIIEA